MSHAILAIALIFINNLTFTAITNIALSSVISFSVLVGIHQKKHELFPWGLLASGVILIGISTVLHSLITLGLIINEAIPFWIEQLGILLVTNFAFFIMLRFERRFNLKGFTIDFSLIVISLVCLFFILSPNLLSIVVYDISFSQQLLLAQVLIGFILLSMTVIEHLLCKHIGFKDLVRVFLILLFVTHFIIDLLLSFGALDNQLIYSRISWSIYLITGSITILFVFLESLNAEDISQNQHHVHGTQLMWVASILAILAIPVGIILRWQFGFDMLDPIIVSIVSICLSSIVIWRLIILFIQTNQQRKKLASIAHTDTLTGLNNYFGYLDKLTAMRSENRLVVGINIEDFKAINEFHGRKMGDQVLKSLARRLQQIPSLEFAARTDADLFFAVFHAPKEQVESVVNSIKHHLGVWDTILDQRITVPLTYSASHSELAIAPEQQARQVEKALKNARKQHSSFVNYANQPEQKHIPRHELREILQDAIDSNHLPIHFQPIYNLDDGSLKAMELLIRVQSKEHGLLLPGQFLEQAKTYDQLTLLTHVCINMVKKYYALLPDVTININLPPYMLDNTELLEDFLKRFKDTNMPAERFCIEVTEDGDIPAQNMIPAVKRLKEFGFTIAMDDFGTGYSTLARLSTLSMDTVKIDRSLLLSAKAGNKAVLEYAIDLIKRLGVNAVVEGVETLEELAMIKRMGADSVQGFLFSKPVHVSEAVNISLHVDTMIA